MSFLFCFLKYSEFFFFPFKLFLKKEYKSGDENKQHEDEAPVQEQKRAAAGNQKAAALQKRDESDDEGKKSVKIPGIYDPADYSNLNVSTEITELFKYVTRY